MKEVVFCGKHGLVIKEGHCPVCQEHWKPFGGEKKEQIGRYSGFSKNKEYGKNWGQK